MSLGHPARPAVFARATHGASNRPPSAVIARILIVLWSLLVVATTSWLTHYSFRAEPVLIPPSLPVDVAGIAMDGQRHHLLIAIHPRCPCSRASVGELERLVASSLESLRCTALIYCPREAGAEWADSPLVASLRKLPNMSILSDVDGLLAERFGMLTSGAVVLYSPRGAVEFYGGITASRGHIGDNRGSAAISRILNGNDSAREAPVYGCPIRRARPRQTAI